MKTKVKRPLWVLVFLLVAPSALAEEERLFSADTFEDIPFNGLAPEERSALAVGERFHQLTFEDIPFDDLAPEERNALSDFDDAEPAGVVVGRNIGGDWRLESKTFTIKSALSELHDLPGALNIISGDVIVIRKGDPEVAGIITNIRNEIDIGKDNIRPYLNGGIRLLHSQNDADLRLRGVDISVGEDDTLIAGEIGAGVELQLRENLLLGFDYRYTLTNKREKSATTEYGVLLESGVLEIHSIMFTLIKRF